MQAGKRWEIVLQNILKDIEEARLMPGDKLPNDVKLADRFGVNRHTVRHAIRVMEADGVLRVVQGRGTFVVENPTKYSLSPKTRLTENLLSQGLLAKRKILSSTVLKAGKKLAGIFRISAGDDVLLVDTVSFHDDVPVTIAHNYFALTRTPNLLDAFSGTNSISDALKRIGIDDFRRRWTRIDARLPTQQEAELLQMTKAKPVFESESLDTVDGTPIKYGNNISCAERITIMIDFDDILNQR